MLAAQAVSNLHLQTEQRMSAERATMRSESDTTAIHLMNHVLTMSNRAMENSMAMGRMAQSPGGATSASHLLHDSSSSPEVAVLPNPGMAALLGPLGPSPLGSSWGGGKGKGKGAGKGKGKPIIERRVALDGNAYTMSEFQQFFGGLQEWEEAGV